MPNARYSGSTGRRLAGIAAVVLLSGCATHTVAVWEENDSIRFGSSEFSNYSNGIQFTLSPTATYASCRPECSSPLHWLVDRINVFEPGAADSRAGETRLRYGFGQQFFTPNDVTLPTLQPDDRPYAGWLFGVLDVVNEFGADVTAGKAPRYRNSVGLRLGVVGPSSQGEALQKFWHGVCDCDEPQGWRHQLRDEPGFIYRLGHERRLFERRFARDVGFDVIGKASGAIGNVYTGLDLGGTVRVSWRRGGEWAATLLEDIAYEQSDALTTFGVSLYAAVEGRYVARNIFIDGNTWKKSHSVDRKPLVADYTVGIGFHWRRLELRAGFVRRSLQYETQERPVKFGTVVFVWRP